MPIDNKGQVDSFINSTKKSINIIILLKILCVFTSKEYIIR